MGQGQEHLRAVPQAERLWPSHGDGASRSRDEEQYPEDRSGQVRRQKSDLAGGHPRRESHSAHIAPVRKVARCHVNNPPVVTPSSPVPVS